MTPGKHSGTYPHHFENETVSNINALFCVKLFKNEDHKLRQNANFQSKGFFEGSEGEQRWTHPRVFSVQMFHTGSAFNTVVHSILIKPQPPKSKKSYVEFVIQLKKHVWVYFTHVLTIDYETFYTLDL